MLNVFIIVCEKIHVFNFCRLTEQQNYITNIVNHSTWFII